MVENESSSVLDTDVFLFRQLFDMMPQLGWTARPDGWIDYYNKGWYAYTGTNEKMVEGWGWESLHDPALLPEIRERWMQSIANQTPFEMKFPLRGADGNFRWFLTRAVLIRDSEGKPFRWVGINTDIQSEVEIFDQLEKLVEERTQQLRQSKEIAETALETKRRFLATISHEVRTPMSGIMGLSELMCLQELGEDNNKANQAIFDSSKRLLQMLNNVLDASRLEAGKVEIEIRPFPIKAVLGDVRQLVGMEAQKKNLSVGGTFDSAIPDYVFGDELRVRQVLLNLAFNAVKFTDQGKVEINAVVLGNRNDDLTIKFNVADTGVGLSAAQIGKLFQPFEQATTGVNRIVGGTGLGLAISKELVHLMKGNIGVTSEPGHGSLFWLELPFKKMAVVDE